MVRTYIDCAPRPSLPLHMILFFRRRGKICRWRDEGNAPYTGCRTSGGGHSLRRASDKIYQLLYRSRTAGRCAAAIGLGRWRKINLPG
eukprot:gene18888-biopygen14512